MTIYNNIFPRVHLHPILFIFVVISFLTGTFIELFILMFIVFIHEMGHYTMAKLLHWRIQHITLWVFGGVMRTDEHANKPIYEEFLVTIAGPAQHLVLYVLILVLEHTTSLPDSIFQLTYQYNTIIFLFNMLPIWPLDGGKLLYLSLSSFLPFRKAYYFIIRFSIGLTLFFLIYQLFIHQFTLSAFFIMIFLFMENRTEWKQRYYVFIRFLLQRFEGREIIKGSVPLSVHYNCSLMHIFSLFRRGRKHPIYVYFSANNRIVLDEQECLHYYFKDKKYDQTIGEAVNK
ncbi:site-2 protease family protein [Virgibacillus sp. W0430]|uniref:site-2 protease family protein n=1 Tax=Virgibacillus sp. W0430 TaxID=3391580 RepID=UPI003F48F865